MVAGNSIPESGDMSGGAFVLLARDGACGRGEGFRSLGSPATAILRIRRDGMEESLQRIPTGLKRAVARKIIVRVCSVL